MKTTVTGRHVSVTEELRELIARKLDKLERLLNDSAVSAQVILGQQHDSCTAEIVLHARGDHVLRGEGDSTTWARAIGVAADKVEQQAHTLKGKWEARRRRAGVETAPDES
jgi:ribosomal subunit interface protein